MLKEKENKMSNVILRSQNRFLQIKTEFIVIICLAVLIIGCTSIAPFSETAYNKSTSIKASSIALMDKAEEPYSNHSGKVETLLLEAQKAYEYAKERPKNSESTGQWAIMIDSNKNMLAGFFKRWKEKVKLDRTFIDYSKKQIGAGLDTISALESGKEKK